MRLDDVKGFVFDIDGTLVHREGPRRCTCSPAQSKRSSGFAPPAGRSSSSRTAHTYRQTASLQRCAPAGLDVGDDEVLTPLDSVLFYLRTHHPDGPVLAYS